ncbi:MAG: hypothetical protein M1448_01550 [Candidatus Marsarchaeota archaeon]|jgi:large subunit ribosomal protein L19e|nr:hypothetical protein [Candidatus Marsarchaeota archaeon]
MGKKFIKRIASSIMKRGESSIRIKEGSGEMKNAITRQDVKGLIGKGEIYAKEEKKNMSIYGKLLKLKRTQGRKRGPGRKKGTLKARRGYVYTKNVRAQRRVIKSLKGDSTIDNEQFKKLYRLVKGGTFTSKITLLNHIRSMGVAIDEKKLGELRHG